MTKIKLIHGFTQNNDCLLPFADLLQVVADAQVEIVEAPHHGNSPLKGGTLEQVGAEVGHLFRDDDCVFVGYSLGGRILLEALASGSLHRGDVIVFGAAIDEGSIEGRKARIAADLKLSQRVATIADPQEFREFLRTWLAAPLFNEISEDQAQLEARLSNTPQEIAKVLVELSTGLQVGLMDRLKQFLNPPKAAKNRLGYIYGSKDVKFKAVATSLKEEIDRVSVVEVAPCGHFTIGERPYESARAIVEVLRGWGYDY
ncbi:MAG: alpha/beta fold hydrolase [Actinomycetota bacterium]|nr:alpha/beta fold hydrolase [Actinomycetota bacterium]